MAASGNSMAITSTAGTTTSMANAVRNLSLPASLQGRIDNQIITSRKAGGSAQIGDMGPPDRMPMLKKSKSTNTMRQAKRAEGMKPGYCEACRKKFENFEDVSLITLLCRGLRLTASCSTLRRAHTANSLRTLPTMSRLTTC